MITTVEATPTPQKAKENLQEAEKHLADLETRLTHGDMSVSQKDLSSALSEVEYKEKVLEGAEATAVREAKASREKRGRTLHKEFVADASALVTETSQSLIELGKTLNSALDSLDKIKDLKNGFQARLTEIFAGDMSNPMALQFKFNHREEGSFGALDESHIIPRLSPTETILAVFAEALRGRADSRRTGPDAKWWGILKAPQIANGLREMRAITEFVKTQEADDDTDQ